MIADVVQRLLDQNVNGDPRRFDELWEKIPDFGAQIRGAIAEQDSWVYLSPQTYDGWYLVESECGFDLYYQEKGGNCWGTRRFHTEGEALKALLQSVTDIGL